MYLDLLNTQPCLPGLLTKINFENVVFQTYVVYFMIITLFYQVKLLIGFWCKHGSNPKYFIQRQNFLPIELIEWVESLILRFISELSLQGL